MSKTITLHTGAPMPTIGLGTWQAQDEEELERALDSALEAGYRFIDTAYLYGNEAIVGRTVQKWLDEGKGTREELFISTKCGRTYGQCKAGENSSTESIGIYLL